MTKKTYLLLSLLFSVSLDSASAQIGEKFTIAAAKTSEPPVIDGKVDEEVWKTAPTWSGLIQFEPFKGEPATVGTVFKVLYDSDYMYFAFLCEDPEPEKISLGTSRTRRYIYRDRHGLGDLHDRHLER